jgi:low affinity Fe/Cu permease
MAELVNEQCREQALIQTKLGNFIMAMRWYNTAAARTIGHKKSDAYEAKAKWCAEMAGASYDRCYFAEDWEAVEVAA